MRTPAVFLFAAGCLLGQARPSTAQPGSSIEVSGPKGAETIEIRNVTYEVTGTGIPGRPRDQRLVLRQTTRSKRILDDIGVEAATTLDAWVFPADLNRKPLYSLTVPGTGGRTVDGSLWVVSRGLEELDWWSVYTLGGARHLFDTYVPLVGFSISRESVVQRYAGLEVPPDDTADVRLKRPGVVAVLTYASEERVIRELLITCDDARQARLLRSYADTAKTVELVDGPARQGLKIAFSQRYPSPPDTVTVQVPIAGDELDGVQAQAPRGIHLSAWKR